MAQTKNKTINRLVNEGKIKQGSDQMGFYDYSPEEIKNSLNTTEAKIASIGGESGFDDQISVDVTPEEATTFVSKVDEEGNRRPETEISMEDMKIAINDNFAEGFVPLGISPIEFLEHQEDLFEQTGVIHPAVPLMYSDDPKEHAVVLKALNNQDKHVPLHYKMTPEEKAMLYSEPLSAGPRIDWQSTADRAKDFGRVASTLATGNPVAQAMLAYETVRNLEIGKTWTLDDALSNLKNKKGLSILVGKRQEDKGGY